MRKIYNGDLLHHTTDVKCRAVSRGDRDSEGQTIDRDYPVFYHRRDAAKKAIAVRYDNPFGGVGRLILRNQREIFSRKRFSVDGKVLTPERYWVQTRYHASWDGIVYSCKYYWVHCNGQLTLAQPL